MANNKIVLEFLDFQNQENRYVIVDYIQSKFGGEDQVLFRGDANQATDFYSEQDAIRFKNSRSNRKLKISTIKVFSNEEAQEAVRLLESLIHDEVCALGTSIDWNKFSSCFEYTSYIQGEGYGYSCAVCKTKQFLESIR